MSKDWWNAPRGDEPTPFAETVRQFGRDNPGFWKAVREAMKVTREGLPVNPGGARVYELPEMNSIATQTDPFPRTLQEQSTQTMPAFTWTWSTLQTSQPSSQNLPTAADISDSDKPQGNRRHRRTPPSHPSEPEPLRPLPRRSPPEDHRASSASEAHTQTSFSPHQSQESSTRRQASRQEPTNDDFPPPRLTRAPIGACWCCHHFGHRSGECKYRKDPAWVHCFRCGLTGVKCTKCPYCLANKDDGPPQKRNRHDYSDFCYGR